MGAGQSDEVGVGVGLPGQTPPAIDGLGEQHPGPLDERLVVELTGRVFAAWRRELADLLERGGLGRTDAETYASTLIAACEGAVVVSRAERSLAPCDQVADFLLRQIPPMAR